MQQAGGIILRGTRFRGEGRRGAHAKHLVGEDELPPLVLAHHLRAVRNPHALVTLAGLLDKLRAEWGGLRG